jgi:1-phosphatidylinositol-4-phosphate 5-kinase
MGGNESQISPIPPVRYGDRFIKFISGVTMSRERAEQTRHSTTLDNTIGSIHPCDLGSPVNDSHLSSVNIQYDENNPTGTDRVIERAERSAERSRHGHSNNMDEKSLPDRSLGAVKSPEHEMDGAILPVIGEAAESSSQASQKGVKVN